MNPKKRIEILMEETGDLIEAGNKRKSLDFNALRDEGLEFIQELSGNSWTDYNAHDPGVTILEQLCFALTDIAYRTSLPVTSFLAPAKGEHYMTAAYQNAFFTPSSVLSSHPVTEYDLKKQLLDNFNEIENVWISFDNYDRGEERLRGIRRVEILPKTEFRKNLKTIVHEKRTIGLLREEFYDKQDDNYKSFVSKVHKFFNENRCLGEDLAKEDIILLRNQDVSIDFEIYVSEKDDIHQLIADVFIILFEFIYRPVHRYSLDEMKADGYTVGDIFSGPQMNRGFIKEKEFREKLIHLHVQELEKIILKVDGIQKCIVKSLKSSNTGKTNYVNVEKDSYINVLKYKVDGDTDTISPDYQFDRIHKRLKVFTYQTNIGRKDYSAKDIVTYNKDKVNRLVRETWSKKHRAFDLGSQDDFFHMELKGLKREPYDYHSIQYHFPTIYGLGREEISRNEPNERHAKVMQLKGYLLLFEQHLANHLAQLEKMNEFFNINYKHGKKTYFSQRLKNVPGSELLLPQKQVSNEPDNSLNKLMERDTDAIRRIGKIYDHLLARFGEHIESLPWKIYRDYNIIRTDDELAEKLLEVKSKFLLTLGGLDVNADNPYGIFKNEIPKKPIPTSLSGLRAEVFSNGSRKPSGLEQIIHSKTGINAENQRIMDSKQMELLDPMLDEKRKVKINTIKKFYVRYQPLSESDKKVLEAPIDEGGLKLESSFVFGNISFKDLFRRPLQYDNYRVSKSVNSKGNYELLFRKDSNKWIVLLEASEREFAIRELKSIMDFLIIKNREFESLYLIDHILLRDLISSTEFGFCFLSESGISQFRTFDTWFWSNSTEDREERLSEFFEAGLHKSNYLYNSGTKKWDLVYYEVDKANRELKKTLENIDVGLRHREFGDDKMSFLKREFKQFMEAISGLDIGIGLRESLGEKLEKFVKSIKLLSEKERTHQIIGKKLNDLVAVIDKHVNDERDVAAKYEFYRAIASFDPIKNTSKAVLYKKALTPEIYQEEREEIYKNTSYLIRLFNDPDKVQGQLKLAELDKNRKDRDEGVKLQKRLVYQRKVNLGELVKGKSLRRHTQELKKEGFEIIDNDKVVLNEDFFNLKVSFILPDWPVRFQDERFKSYLTDLVQERTPAHISPEIYWVDKNSMEGFEKSYWNWRSTKFSDHKGQNNTPEVKKAAFELYRHIAKFQRTKDAQG